MREPFEFAAKIGPVIGAQGLHEPLLRSTPRWQAFRQSALALWGERKKSLPLRAALRNRDESLLFQQTKAPGERGVIDDENIG